ncbi:unnamed protein product, partial [Symbiodinium sp. KB8]
MGPGSHGSHRMGHDHDSPRVLPLDGVCIARGQRRLGFLGFLDARRSPALGLRCADGWCHGNAAQEALQAVPAVLVCGGHDDHLRGYCGAYFEVHLLFRPEPSVSLWPFPSQLADHPLSAADPCSKVGTQGVLRCQPPPFDVLSDGVEGLRLSCCHAGHQSPDRLWLVWRGLLD